MKEYVTHSIVLHRRPYRERDVIVELFTEELGRVEARVTGGARTLSKLSPHLDPLNRVLVRLVKKNNLTVTDAETDIRFGSLRADQKAFSRALETLMLIRRIVPRGHRDSELWKELNRLFESGDVHLGSILALLGYDPRHARCEGCGSNALYGFSIEGQAFICASCRVKFPENEVVLL